MEPKFQTSFIPKGNFATPGAATISVAKKERTLMGFLALILFVMSVVAAAGAFGYSRYLSYRIGKMGDDLTASRNSIEPSTVNELITADARITSTQALLNSHTVISPIFDYLEANTLKTVRFTEFNYAIGQKGFQVVMKGEARGYQAVALQSDTFTRGKVFINPLFSDLRLDERGNVTFSFTATVDPALVAYAKTIQPSLPASVVPASTSTAATSSAATINRATTTAATTTKSVAATTTQSTSSSPTTIRR
jgi:hypothetical protein